MSVTNSKKCGDINQKASVTWRAEQGFGNVDFGLTLCHFFFSFVVMKYSFYLAKHWKTMATAGRIERIFCYLEREIVKSVT